MTTRTKRCAMSSQVEALIGSDRGLLKDLVKEALHEQSMTNVWRQVLLPLNVNYSCRFGRLLVRRRTVRWALLRVLKTQKTKRRERPLGDVHGVR